MATMSSRAHVYSRERSTLNGKLKCIQCVMVGDGGVGKTDLALRLAAEACGTKISRHSFINFANDIKIKGKHVYLKLLDVPNQEEYDTRALFYSQMNVFLICFSLTDSVSFEHVRSKWYPEIRYFCPNVPVVLVGTKHDLRTSRKTIKNQMESRPPCITHKEGLLMAKEIGAVKYVECSTITKTGLSDVPLKVIGAVLKDSKVPKKYDLCRII